MAGDTGIDATALRARLVPPMPGSRFWGWMGPLLVTAFGTFLRFNRLSVPHAVIFDETYYVPDAWGILRFGVEHNYIASRNALIARGDGRIFAPGGWRELDVSRLPRVITPHAPRYAAGLARKPVLMPSER